MTYLHTLAVAFDQLATWQQIGIGALVLLSITAALGTSVVMLEIGSRSVESAAEQALAEADRLAAEPPRVASFKEPAAKGIRSRRLNQQDFATSERRASLRGQRRMK